MSVPTSVLFVRNAVVERALLESLLAFVREDYDYDYDYE